MININKFLKNTYKINKILFVLPNGLFTIDNEYIDKSLFIIDKLNFITGTPIKIIDADYKHADQDNISDFFEILNLYKSKPFKSVNEVFLTIDIVLKEINNFKFDISKNPYENYLEVTLLIYLMESISGRKSLLSGIWGGNQVKLSTAGNPKSNFTGFIENINEKNLILKKIRDHLDYYPEVFFDRLKEYEDKAYNENDSQHATFLNYRVLQTKYKILLQDRCSLLNNMNSELKDKIDKKIHSVKQLLHGYPVINE